MNAGGKPARGAAAAVGLVVASAAALGVAGRRAEVERLAQEVRDAKAALDGLNRATLVIDAALWQVAERRYAAAIAAELCGRAGCYHGGNDHRCDDASNVGPGEPGAQFRCMAGAYPLDGVMVRVCDCPHMIRLSDDSPAA